MTKSETASWYLSIPDKFKAEKRNTGRGPPCRHIRMDSVGLVKTGFHYKYEEQ